MHMLYIQRRKLPKDTLFFGKGKKKFNLKSLTCIMNGVCCIEIDN